jgi:hypothetical protein
MYPPYPPPSQPQEFRYLSSIAVKDGKVFALFVRSPARVSAQEKPWGRGRVGQGQGQGQGAEALLSAAPSAAPHRLIGTAAHCSAYAGTARWRGGYDLPHMPPV